MAGTIKSYYHRGGSQPLLGQTIPERFEEIARRHPEQEAVVSVAQGQRLTYLALSQSVRSLAKGLMGAGFRKGERIGIWSTDNLQWLQLQMATATAGIILVNINPAYRPAELAYALKCSQVQGLFVIPSFRDSDYLSMLEELLPELSSGPSPLQSESLPFLRSVVLFDPAAPHETRRPAPGYTLWQEIIDAGRSLTDQQLDRAIASLDCDDPINIQYTSGTTGFPKAVVLSHHNILNNAYFAAQAMRFDQRDRLCVPVPFYHCFGMVLANLLCLSVGACIVIPSEHFDPAAVLAAIDREKCTAIHGVPTMFIAELEHEAFGRHDMSSLRTGIMAGAPCPPSLVTRVMGEMHCREILIGYGETEASPLTHLTSAEDSLERQTETVGRNLPHQEVKVVALGSGATLPLGEVGEVCFRGYHLMRGYYDNESATREAVDPWGWLHSGDLGAMDKEGYLKITGRIKEMIIRGGENIYPKEIEEFLFAHPSIQQVAVFGLPDAYYGEVVAAWVQLKPGETLTEDELRAYCKGRLTHYKIPAYIQFVSSFPMTVTGKLQKFRMRDRETERLGLNRAT